MLILYTILIVASTISLGDASAIKGHARPHESGSIKSAPLADKAPKALPMVQQAAILESTKRIYNDESIRRGSLAALSAPVAMVVEQPVKAQSVIEQAPSVAVVQKELPAVVAQAPVAVSPAAVKPAEPVAVQPVVVGQPMAAVPVEQPVVVLKESPVAPVVPVVPVVPEQAKHSEAPIEAKSAELKSAPVNEPAAVAKPKVLEELPAQSERSAVVGSEQPVVVQAPVVAAEPVPVEPVVPVQPVEVVVKQEAPVVPVVVKLQPEVPVVVPVVAQAESDSPLQARKEEMPAAPQPAELHIEVPAPDPGLVLSEPIDSTTKLLIDLDEHVSKFLPAEEQQGGQANQPQVAGIDYSPPAAVPSGKSSVLPMPYSVADEPIVPPLPSLEGVEKASAAAVAAAAPVVSSSSSSSSVASSSPSASSSASQSPSASRQGGQNHQNQQQVITQLLDQLDSLQNRIQDTINQLVARRRYVMSALLRPMGTYVRRVRTNLERLQNRVNQLQSAAVSVGGGQNRPGGFVDAAAIETIRRRIDDISKRISDIVNRIRFSLTPTSAPLNSNGRK